MLCKRCIKYYVDKNTPYSGKNLKHTIAVLHKKLYAKNYRCVQEFFN